MAVTNRQLSRSGGARKQTDDWKERAACRAITPDLFFPLGSTGEAVDQIAAAKEVCQGCPVRRECLQFALETNQGTGIWGGTDEEERRSLRRSWVRAGRPSPEALLPRV